MPDKWFMSDPHMCHENILRFKDSSGNLIRGSKFSSVEEMNETIIENWNKLVKPQDKAYILGDVFVGVKEASVAVELISRLNGHLALYLGNHDHIDQPAYRKFRYIELWSGGKFHKGNFVCSHIPLRPDQMRNGEYNVHGHIHQNLVLDKERKVDKHYVNVCVEHTDYSPVHYDEILQRIKAVS